MAKKTGAVKKASTFGEDLVERMELVLAHHRGDIELEQVWPKPIHSLTPRQEPTLR